MVQLLLGKVDLQLFNLEGAWELGGNSPKVKGGGCRKGLQLVGGLQHSLVPLGVSLEGLGGGIAISRCGLLLYALPPLQPWTVTHDSITPLFHFFHNNSPIWAVSELGCHTGVPKNCLRCSGVPRLLWHKMGKNTPNSQKLIKIKIKLFSESFYNFLLAALIGF